MKVGETQPLAQEDGCFQAEEQKKDWAHELPAFCIVLHFIISD